MRLAHNYLFILFISLYHAKTNWKREHYTRRTLCNFQDEKKGRRPVDIADDLNCSASTVQRVLRMYAIRGYHNDGKRLGQPKKFDDRGVRRAQRAVESNRQQTLADLTSAINTGFSTTVSKSTIQTTIHQTIGMYSRHAWHNPFLTATHHQRQMEWAKEALSWTKEEWRGIIWTDESSVELDYLSLIGDCFQ
jgi:transposase